MKWREMSAFQKILAILGMLCAVAYLVLAMLSLCNIWEIHKAIPRLCFGFAWLCSGILQKSKAISVFYYLIAAFWILSSFWYIFVR